jgi:hypothetical protein
MSKIVSSLFGFAEPDYLICSSTYVRHYCIEDPDCPYWSDRDAYDYIDNRTHEVCWTEYGNCWC